MRSPSDRLDRHRRPGCVAACSTTGPVQQQAAHARRQPAAGHRPPRCLGLPAGRNARSLCPRHRTGRRRDRDGPDLHQGRRAHRPPRPQPGHQHRRGQAPALRLAQEDHQGRRRNPDRLVQQRLHAGRDQDAGRHLHRRRASAGIQRQVQGRRPSRRSSTSPRPSRRKPAAPSPSTPRPRTRPTSATWACRWKTRSSPPSTPPAGTARPRPSTCSPSSPAASST